MIQSSKVSNPSLIRPCHVPLSLAHGVPGSWDGMRPGRLDGKAAGRGRTMDKVKAAAAVIIGLIIVLAAVHVMLHEDRADRSLESAEDDAGPVSIGSMDAFPEVVYAPMPSISSGVVSASSPDHLQTVACLVLRCDRMRIRSIFRLERGIPWHPRSLVYGHQTSDHEQVNY